MKKHLSTQTRKRMLSSIGLILFSVSFVLAQVLVKGTVKDNLGEGVPGASVQVKGTSQGTITDLDGKFAFNVPNKNSILVISFIGYVTVEMKVDTQKPMVITLKEDTKLALLPKPVWRNYLALRLLLSARHWADVLPVST